MHPEHAINGSEGPRPTGLSGPTPTGVYPDSVPVLWQLQVSHYVEKVRWTLDYKRIPHLRHSMLPGLHAVKTKRLSGDTSTAPVLTLDGRSIGDSTRIIAAIEERWPQPPLYPEDETLRRRALELEEFFDEELGPHIRRAFYHELLSRPELVVPLFTQGRRRAPRALLRAGFPALRVAMRRRFEISAESAAHSRVKMLAAMDRLEREISASGYLVGDSFTVADLTAAALFYGVARPPEFPYPMVAVDDLPDSWREFLDLLAHRPGGQWVAQMYRRHRGQSAELTTDDVNKAPHPAVANGQSTGNHEPVSNSQTALPNLTPEHDRLPASGNLSFGRSGTAVSAAETAKNGEFA